MNRKNRT